uniref:Uncharacterized protein n=1 Tax=Anguilla anguilla TaxID=7936 RepID=A0A0E9S5A0_ANGAN
MRMQTSESELGLTYLFTSQFCALP